MGYTAHKALHRTAVDTTYYSPSLLLDDTTDCSLDNDHCTNSSDPRNWDILAGIYNWDISGRSHLDTFHTAAGFLKLKPLPIKKALPS